MWDNEGEAQEKKIEQAEEFWQPEDDSEFPLTSLFFFEFKGVTGRQTKGLCINYQALPGNNINTHLLQVLCLLYC